MLRTVLWVAGACAAVLLALYVSRTLHLDQPPPPAPKPAVALAKPPPKAVAPAAPKAVEAPKPPPTPEEQQVQEDAAATGMTTVEPENAPKDQTPPPN
jgi:hypothetical protein